MKRWLTAGALLVAVVAHAQASGWQPYLDQMLNDTKNVKSAGIYGQDGAVWATSAADKLSPQEVKDLVAGIKDNSKLREKGPLIAGAKYMFVASLSPTSITARKGPNTLLAVTTQKALIVIVTKDGANPGNVTVHDKVAKALIEKGF